MDVSRKCRIAIITLVLQLGACAAPFPGPGQSAQRYSEHGHKHLVPRAVTTPVCFLRTQYIVRDLVAAMAQLPALSPATTTLHVTPPRSRFDILLLESVRQAGYAVRQQPTVEGDKIGTRLGHSVHTDAPADLGDNILQGVYFFTLTAGDVALRRAYRVSETGLRPASSLFVRGADASSVVLDNAEFGAEQTCFDEEFHAARPGGSARSGIGGQTTHRKIIIRPGSTPVR